MTSPGSPQGSPDGGRMRLRYREELDRIETATLDGLDLVIGTLDQTMEAAASRDIDLALQVIADDDRIDGLYLEVHEGLITLLATQSPVATDLRVIAALLHVIKNIERMGDQCVNICKLIPLAGSDPPVDGRMRQKIADMGVRVRAQMLQAGRSFADRDPALARDLVRLDDEVDRLNRECFGLAIGIGVDPGRREWAMTMTLAARALERIGDNAVDIGEQAAFIATGLFREFEDSSPTT